MLFKFIAWFEKDSPNFSSGYGGVMGFYDKDSDSFHIEEIQNAYEQFKRGEDPNSLYMSWSHVR